MAFQVSKGEVALREILCAAQINRLLSFPQRIQYLPQLGKQRCNADPRQMPPQGM